MAAKEGPVQGVAVTTVAEILSTNKYLPVPSTLSMLERELAGLMVLNSRAGSQQTKMKQPSFSHTSFKKQMDSKVCESTVHQVSCDSIQKTFSDFLLEISVLASTSFVQ
jgi:hypothetical protein